MIFQVLCLLLLSQVPGPVKGEVGLRELRADPRRYDGREIVISGLVLFGEGARIVLPSAASGQDDEAMGVTVSPSIARAGDELARRYLQRQRTGGFVVATLRGRFTADQGRVFGHLNCCRFSFQITKVIGLDCTPPSEAGRGLNYPC